MSVYKFLLEQHINVSDEVGQTLDTCNEETTKVCLCFSLPGLDPKTDHFYLLYLRLKYNI